VHTSGFSGSETHGANTCSCQLLDRIDHVLPLSLILRQTSSRFLNCGGIIGYAEDLAFYISKYFWQSGRVHDAFKDQRFWTDMFLAQSLRTGAVSHNDQ